jgi:ribosomal peptide maturation radical SAM protein 1
MRVSGQTLPNLADPVRLNLLHAAFKLTLGELAARGGNPPAPTQRAPSTRDDAVEAARLGGALRAHVEELDAVALESLHRRLARSLLLEIDRRMAGLGTPPGERPDLRRLAAEPPPPPNGSRSAAVALVSLPWMSPAMPSIQLATLGSALAAEGIQADVHELYVDYATRIGLNLYSHLGNLLGFVPEWVFSRHYYGPEHGDDLRQMIEEHPLAEIPWPEFGDSILEALEPVTREYLDEIVTGVDWSRYDVLGCSLTISQLGASMAFARRIKLQHPRTRIVFGGSQCAGPMGRAILRICPYVDVVVHVEGELVLAELVRRLRAGRSVAGLPGVSFRDGSGEVVTSTDTDLFRPRDEKLPLDYDAYFRRLIRLGVLEKMNPWLPFESSRGCWYGQKNQCTFCGLHEIMEFRAWDPDVVLAELERMYAKYGVGRFYSMDLIMPREYLRTMLPEVARRGHDWMFFYELKANMRRHELETLAAAGVRWVQPGIESLDADLLRLMRKGVSPTQNVKLLKWCEELGIFCGWNLLYGLPGESEDSYARMARIIPKLVHLQPPSGGGRFQLHRFSPYFDHPELYGIRWSGAHHMFAYAFPIAKHDLDELVYLHEFEVDGGEFAGTSRVEREVSAWRQAYRAGATLELSMGGEGSCLIVDRRDVRQRPKVWHFTAPETKLYLHLDAGIACKTLVHHFADAHGDAFEALGQERAVLDLVDSWLGDDLMLAVDERFVALALQTARMTRHRRRNGTAEVGAQDLTPMTPQPA